MSFSSESQFSQNFSSYSKLNDFFTTSDSRCSRRSFVENKPKFFEDGYFFFSNLDRGGGHYSVFFDKK
ncbi:hypothetical protein B1P88_01585 [Enterococcus faecium]|nr:hypothetical protein B1P88_01585 [Enterococcus faecium]